MPKTHLTEEEKKEWEQWGREKALNIQISNKNPDECDLYHKNLEPAKTEAWEAWNKGYNTNNIKLSEEAKKYWKEWGYKKTKGIFSFVNPDKDNAYHENIPSLKAEAWEAWNEGCDKAKKEMKAEASTTPPFKKFYLVWKDEKGTLSPTVKHFSEEEARAEAIRLAKEFQYNTFYVVEAISKFQIKSEVIETQSE